MQQRHRQQDHSPVRPTRPPGSGPSGDNALRTDVVRDLSTIVAEACRQGDGVLLCGGEKFFSNGVDLRWALAQPRSEVHALFSALGELVLGLLEAPVPVVGAFRGHAIGGALAVLLACDYRFGATGRVLIGKPEILLGVPNPYFGDQLLRFVAGDFVASDLIYSGRLITAEDGCALQLVHAVAPRDEVEGVAEERLRGLCGLARDAFTESKRMRLGRLCADLRFELPARVARQVEIWHSNESQALLHAAAERLAK